MTDPNPKSALVGVHKLSIGAAIALGALYSAYSLKAYSASGANRDLVIAALTATTTVVMGFYLRWFVKKAR